MENRVRTAREHGKNTGDGSAVLLSKSPRMRVNYAQLDQYLEFIVSPHVVIDLPFGQRLLSLADGSLLETPNLIRTMIPDRIVAQYTQYCKEVNFTAFSRSTMLRVLSSCDVTVPKSLQYGDPQGTCCNFKSCCNSALEVPRIFGNSWLPEDSFARKKSRTFSNSKPETIWLP